MVLFSKTEEVAIDISRIVVLHMLGTRLILVLEEILVIINKILREVSQNFMKLNENK